MKLIVVLGRSAFEQALNDLLEESGVPLYSKVNINGIRSKQMDPDVMNWFGGSVEPEGSIMYFAFVDEEHAGNIMQAVDDLNERMGSEYPFHSFQLGVEQAGKLMYKSK